MPTGDRRPAQFAACLDRRRAGVVVAGSVVERRGHRTGEVGRGGHRCGVGHDHGRAPGGDGPGQSRVVADRQIDPRPGEQYGKVGRRQVRVNQPDLVGEPVRLDEALFRVLA